MRRGVCTFIYKKCDGSIRTAMGTLDRNILNSTLGGGRHSPEEWEACFYHDCLKGGGRSFKWENLLAVLS